jgi:hypothetical protein
MQFGVAPDLTPQGSRTTTAQIDRGQKISCSFVGFAPAKQAQSKAML